MAKPLLTDGLWQRIKPHLPPEPPKPKGVVLAYPIEQALSESFFV